MDRSRSRRRLLPLALLFLLAPEGGYATVFHVPGDFSTIQLALDAAQAGDTVEVASGTYLERLVFPRSGSAGSPIVLRAASGAVPIVDGTGVGGSQHLILIESRSHLRVEGLELRNNLGVTDGSGIRIEGSGSDLELVGNRIHHLTGANAMGITVYGTEPTAISGLLISGNEIWDAQPSPSEALTLNGNIDGFEIRNNEVRDVNNIGIDLIGGETDIQLDPSLVARNGAVRGNRVLRANSNYGGGYAGGIYLDGARDVIVENNLVTGSDLGIEIGAENAGIEVTGVVVRNNLVYLNERAGIAIGGYDATVGRVVGCEVRGNTLWGNNIMGDEGEIWLQWGSGTAVGGNLVVAGSWNVFVASFDPASTSGETFDYNLYHSEGGVEIGAFSLNGVDYEGFTDWQNGTGYDAASRTDDPILLDPPFDFHLDPSSPARGSADPLYVPEAGEVDLDGEPRQNGDRVDIGVDELHLEIFVDGFETGDTSAWDAAQP